MLVKLLAIFFNRIKNPHQSIKHLVQNFLSENVLLMNQNIHK
jgi:hypothetical protein